MKKILILLMAVLGLEAAFAQTDTKADFSSVCSSGQVLYYKIIDEGEVNLWFHNEYPEMLGGYVVVPRSVKYGGKNYIVTGIGDRAFANCIRMQGIELPNTLFVIGERAFYRCTDLRVIAMSKSVTSIGASAFESCVSLVDVVIPDAVVEMGAYAFKDCVKVRHFVISHSLEYIPEGAFLNCKSVTDYIIPASVATFGRGCFDGYEALKIMMFLGTVPPVPEEEPAFGREIPITVPGKVFDTYKASYIWGQYDLRRF